MNHFVVSSGMFYLCEMTFGNLTGLCWSTCFRSAYKFPLSDLADFKARFRGRSVNFYLCR